MLDLKYLETPMSKTTTSADNLIFEDLSVFVNSEIPDTEYTKLSDSRDMGISLSVLDIYGDPVSFVLSHDLVKETISILKTVDDNLKVMNSEKF
jgi:hypothetical protein